MCFKKKLFVNSLRLHAAQCVTERKGEGQNISVGNFSSFDQVTFGIVLFKDKLLRKSD